jgi:hypothetical protein
MIDIKAAKKSETAPTIKEGDFNSCGFRCIILFVRQSHRCGYIAIPRGHPAFEMSSSDLPIDVHGGLTFGSCEPPIKEIEKSEDVWFGFDCAHSGDNTSWHKEENGHFWTMEEVANECIKMSREFKNLTLRKIIEYKLEYMPNWFKENIKIILPEQNE